MSDRIQTDRSGEGTYEMERFENGQRYIFRTDSEVEFIRAQVDQLFIDFELGGKVSIEELPDRWMRIEIQYPRDIESDVWMEIAGTFLAAFGGGKGWYECRDCRTGPDEFTESYICRHRSGPWL